MCAVRMWLFAGFSECQNWTKALEVADELKEPFRYIGIS